MDEKIKCLLEENGADVAGTIRRFVGNEAIYRKFLCKFCDDPNYGDLVRNLEQKNYEEAFKCAHTLKGVAANLGLDPLCIAVSDLTEELRNKTAENIDEAAVTAKMEKTVAAYNVFYKIITENL